VAVQVSGGKQNSSAATAVFLLRFLSDERWLYCSGRDAAAYFGNGSSKSVLV
jgi:hypothetical protein